MKKITAFLLASMMATTLMGCEKDDKVVKPTALPDAAQTFLNDNYASESITRVVKDYDDFSYTYEVFLSDGTFVEFNKHGEWQEVENKVAGVRQSVVPTPIWQWVAENHSGRFIKAIDRDVNDYDVELDNGLDITFDHNGNFLYYDN